MTKLNFYDWFAERESFYDGCESDTNFIKQFTTVGAWLSYDKNEPNHCGDCTSRPVTCGLCALEGLLREYRMYYFDKWNGEEIFHPGKGLLTKPE